MSDYGDDDGDFLFNLDADDLRMLEEVEEKCGVDLSRANSMVSGAQSTAAASHTRGADPPPAKRARLGTRTPIQQVHLSDDDTPDILLNADGTYGVDSAEPSLVSIPANPIMFSGPTAPLTRESSWQPAPTPRVSESNGSRSLQRYGSVASIDGFNTPPATQGARPPVRAAALSQAIRNGAIKGGTQLSQNATRVNSSAPVAPRDANLHKELEALRVRLAATELERQELQASLDKSKENNFAKAGEAENLRRMLNNQKIQHMEQVARFHQDMADAQNAKLDLERRMKLEMDQLRTAMTFKQYERETSRRSFPNVNASLRKQQASQTPDRMTPTVLRTMEMPTPSPLSPKKKASRATMLPPPLPVGYTRSVLVRKEKSFSNLTNSFNQSTSPIKLRNRATKPDDTHLSQDDSFAPMYSSTQHPPKDKGKGKANPEDAWTESQGGTPARRLTFDSQDGWEPPRLATQAPFAIEPDVFGPKTLPQTPVKVAQIATPRVDTVRPVDRADELRVVLLTHIILFRPPEGERTFSLQHLLTVPITPDLHKRFMSASTLIFDAFSTSTSSEDGERSIWDQCASNVALGLTQLAPIFNGMNQLDPLCILFNLLVTACTTISAFASYLLAADAQDDASPLVSVICSAILRCTKDNINQNVTWDLGESAILLCETLGWYAADDGVARLSALARTKGVLQLMLNPSCPDPWIIRSTRTLSVLASRNALVRGLLNFSETDPPSARGQDRVPIVELLSAHLAAYRKHNTREHHRVLLENVLTALSQVALADAQCLKILSDSPTLIPSITSFVYYVTSAIWSELELFENSSSSHDNCLADNLRLAIQLLHYIAFNTEPLPDIRAKLYYAPLSLFNGLVHMYIISFSRLGTADCPECMDETCTRTIREIRGMSQSLLEIVVDGPEVDGIYHVYDKDNEEGVRSEDVVDASVQDEEEELRMSIDGL